MKSNLIILRRHKREKESLLQDQRPRSTWTVLKSKFGLFSIFLIHLWLWYFWLINRQGYYPLLRNGELIPVTVSLNKQTNFAKLQVGKQIVTARQRKDSQNLLFPQTVAVVGLAPLIKVWANYLPPPKNEFIVKVNGDDYYTFPKEDVDFDPS